jgi:hypothetical protein
MSELEEIEQRIRKLSPAELAKFRAWFAEFDHLLWDRQIEADAKAGKLDKVAAEALAEYKAGKTKEI